MKKPYGYYKKKSLLIKSNKDNQPRAKIILWDYFKVNRETGSVMDNCCRVQLIDGKAKGNMYDLHCSSISDDGSTPWTWE